LKCLATQNLSTTIPVGSWTNLWRNVCHGRHWLGWTHHNFTSCLDSLKSSMFVVSPKRTLLFQSELRRSCVVYHFLIQRSMSMGSNSIHSICISDYWMSHSLRMTTWQQPYYLIASNSQSTLCNFLLMFSDMSE
jgi:hypothetical protein